MTGFMVGGNLLLLLRQEMALPFRTKHHLLNGTDEVELCELGAVLPRRENSGFIHDGVEVSAGKSGGALRNHTQCHVLAELLFQCMHLQYLLAVVPVGKV